MTLSPRSQIPAIQSFPGPTDFQPPTTHSSSLETVKTRSSKLLRSLCLLCLVVWALAPPASAQPRPSLGLQFSAGQPRVSLIGEVGTVYSIQYATGFSSTYQWVDRTLLPA